MRTGPNPKGSEHPWANTLLSKHTFIKQGSLVVRTQQGPFVSNDYCLCLVLPLRGSSQGLLEARPFPWEQVKISFSLSFPPPTAG